MQVFISSNPADKANALQLQQFLTAIDPAFRISLWNGGKYLEHEYRAAAKTFLEQADMFVAVHSADYQLLPTNRWELETAIAEQARRQGALRIVVVQARHAVLSTHLRGYTVLPGPEEAIEGVLTERQLVRTSRTIHEMLRAASVASAPVADMRPLPITLPDLQERLHLLADRHNLLDVLALLHNLLHDEGMARSSRQLEDDFLGADLKFGVNLNEYHRSVAAIKTRLYQLIEGIDEEIKLHANWRTLFLEQYRYSALHRSTAFFFPNDEIRIPETLNLPAAADGTEEHTGFLSYEQKLEFRRLLLLCQDALMVEKYAAAHHYCEQVRTQIDPQSAQLYEYLLVSFVKKEQPLTIIKRLFDGVPSAFNHVKLYSDRYNQYQNAHPPQCPSDTGVHNQGVAVEELAAALHYLYSSISSNAVCDTGALAVGQDAGRQTILNCLEGFTKLFHALSPTPIFIDTLLMELVGGGKFNWMERVTPHPDGSVSFISNGNFDLKGKTSELLVMLEDSDPRRVPPKQREMVREDLFWHLLMQCERLATQVREEKRLHHNKTDLRRSVVRLVQACMAGHYLLTQPGDVLEAEKSLLRLAIELLVPNLLRDGGRYDLPIDILLDWFTLDAQGQLAKVDTGFEFRDFDALAILENIVGAHAGSENWPIIKENIHQAVWEKYLADTETKYEQVRLGLQYTDFRRMDALEARKILIDCHQRRMVCHRAFPQAVEMMPARMVRELVGEGLLLWFVLRPSGVYNHPDADFYAFDAKAELHALLQENTDFTEPMATAAVVHNLYTKQLLPAYAQVRAGVEADRPKAAAALGAILMAFKTHPLPEYLDAAHKEIVLESKFKWIDIDRWGKPYNFSTDFDALALLDQMMDVLPLRYPPYDTRRKIADNRWNEQLKRYENEISPLRYENRLAERQTVAEIIWRLKGVYLYFNDRKYLELPMLELHNQGRVRWFNRFWGIFRTNGNHFENDIIGFDLKAERIEIQMYWDRMVEV